MVHHMTSGATKVQLLDSEMRTAVIAGIWNRATFPENEVKLLDAQKCHSSAIKICR
jgi:hypothetical protein